MNKKSVLALIMLGGLTITGCSKNIDNVEPDDPREVKDEVYSEYLTEKYGEEYPELDVSVAVDYSLRLCSVLGSQNVTPADLDDWLTEEGLGGRERVVFGDMMYSGVKVYCPENLGEVEHLRPVNVGSGERKGNGTEEYLGA